MTNFLPLFLLFIHLGIHQSRGQHADIQYDNSQIINYGMHGTLNINHTVKTDSSWNKVNYEINFIFESDTVYKYSTVDDWWRLYFREYGLSEDCPDTVKCISNWYKETVPNNIIDTLQVSSEDKKRYLGRVRELLNNSPEYRSNYSITMFKKFTTAFSNKPLPYIYILRDHFIPPVMLIFDPLESRVLRVIY